MAGLVQHPNDLITAVQCASVSVRRVERSLETSQLADFRAQASFVIEQFGLPSVERGEDGFERWNGVDPHERLAEMRSRQ